MLPKFPTQDMPFNVLDARYNATLILFAKLNYACEVKKKSLKKFVQMGAHESRESGNTRERHADRGSYKTAFPELTDLFL
jgi:hypothetical protein